MAPPPPPSSSSQSLRRDSTTTHLPIPSSFSAPIAPIIGTAAAAGHSSLATSQPASTRPQRRQNKSSPGSMDNASASMAESLLSGSGAATPLLPISASAISSAALSSPPSSSAAAAGSDRDSRHSVPLLPLHKSSPTSAAPTTDDDDADDDPMGKKSGLPLMSSFQMVKLNAFWFGYQFYWLLIGIVIVPKQIEDIMGPDRKGSGLSYISLSAGVLNLFLAVLLGALNDRVASRFGKRRIWMIVGSVAMCGSLLLLSGQDSLLMYTLGYLCMTSSTVIASVPFNGLLSDVTPQEQKGAVSAIMGFMNLAGYLAGAVVGAVMGGEGGLGISGLYTVMMFVVASTTAVTVLSTSEPSSMHLIGLAPIDWPTFLRDLVRPLWTHVDFRLVFFSRFLFQLGIATVQQFLQYWIGDCVSITIPAPQAVSYALMPLLILSPIGAMCIPAKKRKIVVYIAAVLMITTCLLLETVTSFEMALVVSGIFGLGYGPFISTEFAMLMDVLPSEEEAAKDMALWHSALVLPQIVATPIAGWMLDTFQRVGRPTYQCLGYNVVFAVCIVYFVGGAIVTKRIKGVQ